MNFRPHHAVIVFALLAAGLAPAAGPLPQAASADAAAPKVRLGRQLFFDAGLSEPAGQSCAGCHAPEAAFTDPDRASPTSQGVHRGRFGSRNAPTAMYAAASPAFRFDAGEGHYVGGQFLDGRAAGLEEQAKLPFLNPVEMANPDPGAVVDKLRGAPYAGLFREVYGADALGDSGRAFGYVADAIAAFERSRELNPYSSKYDAWLAGRAQLSAREKRGLALYEDPGKGNCAACHPSRPGPDGSPPLFTDFTYDNLGVPKNPDNRFYGMPPQFNPDGAGFVDRGLGAAVGRPGEDGKFKVPTLRNIAVTGPYMHNGYFRTLRGVVDFYNTRDARPACSDAMTPEAQALRQGCWPAPEVAGNVNRDELGDLGLSGQEVDDIVAFLRTLGDGWQPGP